MPNFCISKKNLNIYENEINGKINLKDDSNTYLHFESPNSGNSKKIFDFKQLNKSDKNKNIFFTNFNSNHILWKEYNSNNCIDKTKNKKEANSYCENCKKIKNTKKGGNIDIKKRKLTNKEYLNRMCLSKESISKMEHIDKKSNDTLDEKIKKVKYFSFVHYLKSLIFKIDKERQYFLDIFRKHLLSEEHLLKSHIKMIFLEKQQTIVREENTNVLECFNEL